MAEDILSLGFINSPEHAALVQKTRPCRKYRSTTSTLFS